jgi:hypothetical protein
MKRRMREEEKEKGWSMSRQRSSVIRRHHHQLSAAWAWLCHGPQCSTLKKKKCWFVKTFLRPAPESTVIFTGWRGALEEGWWRTELEEELG